MSDVDRVEIYFMTKLRQILAMGLGTATLCIFLAIVVGNVQVSQAGLAPWPGVSAIALVTAAFIVSWKQNSLVVTGLLIAAGVTGIITGVRNTDFFAVIVFPGPIIGIIIGLGIFGPGMAKALIR
jgi:hypothetical protein